LQDPEYPLEISGTDTVAVRMATDVFFADVVVASKGLQDFEDALLLGLLHKSRVVRLCSGAIVGRRCCASTGPAKSTAPANKAQGAAKRNMNCLFL
jgi:hypothetical protein